MKGVQSAPIFTAIGPVTEARIAAAFSSTAEITAKAAGLLIGLDVRTLRDMTAAGIIGSVPKGRLRAYTEGNIRAYLERSDAECLPSKPPRQKTVHRQTNVVPFSQRKGARRRDRL